MPKVTVYVNKSLHARAVEAGLPLTKICQAAIADSLDERMSVAEMVATLKDRIDRIITVLDLRTDVVVDRLVAHGVDPAQLLADLPWLREHSASLRPAIPVD